MRSSDPGLERAAPAADAGRDEPDNAVMSQISQPLTAVVTTLLFLQRQAAELTARLCQARHVPQRRRGAACPGAHAVTAESRAGAFPWAGEGQAQGYPGEQQADPCTRIPSPPGEGNFQTGTTRLVPSEQN